MSIYYVECPYCEKETEIELENEIPNEEYKETCEECGKEYTYYFEFDVNIYPSKIESHSPQEMSNEGEKK